MPDVIDSFVVALGLDPRNYKREIKDYRDDRKRLAEEDAKYNKASEDAQKRNIQGIRTLRNETAGFLFMLAGANSVKDFASNLLAGDAATGRLAKNLGLATSEVSAWEGAVKRVGGSASDIQNTLRAMASAWQSLQLTGTTGHDADFQGLGLTSKDLQNPSDALLKIADASSRMSRPEFNARLKRIGFDENTINLLARGRGEVSRMLEEQRKLGVATDESTEAAQKFQEQMAKIESGITGKLRPALTNLAAAFGDWITQGNNLNNLLIVTGALVGGLALAAAAAYWPFLLLAGAIAVVVTNLDKIRRAWDELPDLFKTHVGPKPQDAPSGESVGGFWGMLGVKQGGSHARGQINPSGTLGDPAAGGGGRAGVSNGGGGRTAARVEQYFKARGYTANQARGIAAAVVAEGGLSARTGGGYKGRALGVGQLLGDRRAEFLRRYGPNFTFENELEFMHWELQGGDPGGASVRRQTTAAGTLGAMVGGFYRPAKGRETTGDLNRGLQYLGLGSLPRSSAGGGNRTSTNTQTVSIGQITIYTPESTAPGIADGIRGELAKRGVVTQANTGLQP